MKNNAFFLFLLLLSFIAKPLYSQDFWEIVPTPDTANPWTITIHNNGDIFSGSNGVYLSQDNGETWEYKGLFGNTIYSIATDSLNNIFAGASGVLYKSTDYGDNWYSVISGLDNIFSIECLDNGLMFVGSGYDVGIIRSIDYGETWDTVFMVPGWEEYIFDIEAGPDNEVYAATTAWMGNGGGVYRSVDEGETWEHIGLLYSYVMDLALDSNGKLYAAVYGHHYTFIGGCYVYDEENSEWIYLTQDLNADGIVINSIGDIYLGVSNAVGGPGGIYNSMDGGATWQWVNSGLAGNTIEKVFLSPDEYIYAITYGIHILHRSINPTVSVIEKDINHSILKVFPNPFNEYTILSVNFPVSTQRSQLVIYDISGKIVERRVITIRESTRNIKIDGKEWMPGIYLYQLRINNQTFTGKIIKS
ncbi:MAG: T9SS type A sorting domain-containing protein [Bacteroidales bacterium]|nr:T9SS type A sorting domain-containing protein [Bacteroidales bacterium]